MLEEKSVRMVDNEMSNIEDIEKEETSGLVSEDIPFNVARE
jgi:hypothetical protein